MKSLGLVMICANSDAADLQRCLSSVTPAGKPKLFDLISVCNASPTPSDEVRAVVEGFGGNYVWTPWEDDFASARNSAVRMTFPTEWLMWLDADDVIKPAAYDSLLSLKPQDVQADVILMPYAYSHDKDDKATMILPRERIIRREHMIWQGVIHEAVTITHLRLARVDIQVDHYRSKPVSPDRNINLLKATHETDPDDRTLFYLGKELCDWHRYDEGLPLLDRLVKRGDGFSDNIAVACHILSANNFMVKKDLAKARYYAVLGLLYSDAYSELWCDLGYSYEASQDIDAAISAYKMAAKCQYGAAGFVQLKPYYYGIPLSRLAYCFAAKNEWHTARDFTDLALNQIDDAGVKELHDKAHAYIEHNDGALTLGPRDYEYFKKILEGYRYKIACEKNDMHGAVVKINRLPADAMVWLWPFEGGETGK